METVRLSVHDYECLEQYFKKHFLLGDKMWIFGSRVDLTKRGGDIDLYIETSADDAIKRRLSFLSDLESEIGEQKIDIILNILKFGNSLPIYEVAKSEGVRVV